MRTRLAALPHLRALALSLAIAATTTPVLAATSQACSSIPHADHPKVTLRQGDTTAVLFLPDPVNGYYRASRFDWPVPSPASTTRDTTSSANGSPATIRC